MTKYQKAFLRRSLLKLKPAQRKHLLVAIGRILSANEQLFLDLQFFAKEIAAMKSKIKDQPGLATMEAANVILHLQESMSASKKSKDNIKFLFDCLIEKGDE